MPRLKFSRENLAAAHLVVQKKQHREMFRIAKSEGRSITAVFQEMLDLYKKKVVCDDNKEFSQRGEDSVV